MDVIDVEKAVARVQAGYEDAVHAKDAQALMRLYDPQARIFDAWGVWTYEDAAAWQRAVEGWFTSLGAERAKVRFEDVRTTVLGRDAAAFSAIACYEGLSPQGEVLRHMHNRITWVLRLSGHVLRIVHEHTSAPIGFDDGKAILKRQRD
jgi:ketosteroid isomerase-like protein